MLKETIDTILKNSEEVLLRMFGEEGHLFLEKFFFGLIRTLGALIDSWPSTENVKKTLSCYSRMYKILGESFKNYKVAFQASIAKNFFEQLPLAHIYGQEFIFDARTKQEHSDFTL